MAEPTIRCPHCDREFELNKSLAAPLIDATRKEFEQLLAQKDDEVAVRLKAERGAIAEAEARKAREAVSDELARTEQEKRDAEERVKDRDAKLKEARKNELELRQERQALQEEKERFELDKQKAIDEERSKIRDTAQKDADEKSRLKLAEREKTIDDLQKQLQEALRKAEQGSQQLQGEIQELELEAILREKFPRDTLEPVPKGEHGGDAIQRVFGPAGQPCGSILWESKRTKNWSDGWLPKLREDMRAAGAEVAVVVSQALPKDTESFDLVDGVWVTSYKCAIPVAVALRHALIEVSAATLSSEGQQTKMAMVYQYLTGSRFRHRIEAIVEKFRDMQEDLERERKSMTRLWAKREAQIRGVIESTAGMYGDLQGIAGKSLQEIAGLELPRIETDGPSDPPQDRALEDSEQGETR